MLQALSEQSNPSAVTGDALAALHQAIAEELRLVANLVEGLATQLVADGHFVAHHLDSLQSFDLIAQHAGESARVLDRLANGTTPDAAVKGVGLAAMHDRLHAMMSGG
ncbi:MAG: hypothetical protein ACTHMG_02145 [Sphingomonas sp.]